MVLIIVNAVAYASAYHFNSTPWAQAIGPLMYVMLLVGVGAVGTIAVMPLMKTGKSALGVSLIPVVGLICNFAYC